MYPASFIAAFAAKVSEPDANDCMLWTGTLNDQGYGLAWKFGERYAHRHSFQIHNGRIPLGKLVRHRCDVKNCVNPAHLIIGTKRDNAKDALERGRFASGSRRRSDLSNDIIYKARVDFHKNNIKLAVLAERLGMSVSQTSDTMSGRLWRDAPMPAGVRRRARRRKLTRDRRKTS